MNRKLLAMATLSALTAASCQDLSNSRDNAEPIHATITIRADRPGPKINPQMWGAFFEDINFGADGGLYAELVKNRSFEFPEPLMGWFKIAPSLAKGDLTIMIHDPARETNTHYLRIKSEADAPVGLSNEGFRGIGLKVGDTYDFSTSIRIADGSPPPKVFVELMAHDGTTLARSQLTGLSSSWSKATTTLTPTETDPKARLTLTIEGKGTVDVDMVSLFPQKTWKNRPGGLRADMVQMLADLHPGFLRFPGGCIVEGSVLDRRYQWKNTIGPVEDRKLLINRWNYEFKWRPTPDYFQSFGLGFFEFFQLCEDIGAAPLPILNCGMACQFNSGELCPPEQLGPYIQDALDLIEFANGPATSTWGAKRAAMGHPEPFNPPLKMMGVGNEQWGPQYLERLTIFTKAIKEKYPAINLVSDAGPSPDDDRFQYLWPKLQEFKSDGHSADIVDQHCYANPIWFLSNSHRFDSYNRAGPKIFFGEYAAQSVAICSTKNRNNLECALAEAAFMTGLERNADVVRMASYAPLFANVDAWQWTPNLMWTDSLRVVATPNYYVQQLYCKNRGDVVLPTSNDAPIQTILPTGRIGVGTFKTAAEFKEIRLLASTEDKRGNTSIVSEDVTADSTWTGGPTWKTVDGAYQQSDAAASVTSFLGQTDMKNYTLTLKARKLSGSEGFIITILDNPAAGANGARAQWILGGWGNTQNGIVTHYAEQDQIIERIPGSIEPNRWYDIKIILRGGRMECYLDGKLLQSAEVLTHKVPALFTSASRDDSTGETILKVINPGDSPAHASIRLRGIPSVRNTAQLITLAGSPNDENTLDQPTSITPKTTEITIFGPDFNHTFQPRSMTILRLGTKSP